MGRDDIAANYQFKRSRYEVRPRGDRLHTSAHSAFQPFRPARSQGSSDDTKRDVRNFIYERRERVCDSYARTHARIFRG